MNHNCVFVMIRGKHFIIVKKHKMKRLFLNILKFLNLELNTSVFLFFCPQVLNFNFKYIGYFNLPCSSSKSLVVI